MAKTNMTEQDTATLYLRHLEEKMTRFQSILSKTGFSELLIGSGQVKTQFQDDLFYPFKANPYFKEWVPLNRRENCYLHIKIDDIRPRLLLLDAEDIWHTAPQVLPHDFERGLDIMDYTSSNDVLKLTGSDPSTTAFIGETNSLHLPVECCNPQILLNHIDFQRRHKTDYEQFCVREANRLAIPPHKAAYQAFKDGASELEISAAYLSACDCSENHMPYPIIAGINEHAAVLHHSNLSSHAPQQRHSFLIDAGVDFHGYASDITRTYAYDPDSEFAEMVQIMDIKQQELVATGAIGAKPVEIHRLAHRKVAETLCQFGILKISPDEALETGLTEHFFPHGVGHHLGINVHDKGTKLANPQGEVIPPPDAYPKLRQTTPMVANQIYTVEPGLYFIPLLLKKLSRGQTAAKLDWSRVKNFLPYGGIRIEDNIVLHEDGSLENLTRNAFRQVA